MPLCDLLIAAQHSVLYLRDILLRGPEQELVSYAKDDVESPACHGVSLAEFFAVTVNVEDVWHEARHVRG